MLQGAAGRGTAAEAFGAAYGSRDMGQPWPPGSLPSQGGSGLAPQLGYYSPAYAPGELLYHQDGGEPYNGLSRAQLAQQQQHLIPQQLDGPGRGPGPADVAGGLQQVQLLDMVQPRGLQRPSAHVKYQQLAQAQEQLGGRPPLLMPLASEELLRGRPQGEPR